VPSDCRDQAGAHEEVAAGVLVDEQVEVALAVAGLRVYEPMERVRERPLRLGQKPELVQRFLFDVPRARTGDPGSRFSTDPNRNSSGVIDANAPQPAGQKPKTPPDETIERDHPNKPKIDEVPDKPGDKVEQKDDLDDPD